MCKRVSPVSISKTTQHYLFHYVPAYESKPPILYVSTVYLYHILLYTFFQCQGCVSLVNQPYFLGGGENTSGHTCTTLLAGRNFGYVIIQIMLTTKTNFRYVKNVFTLRSNFGKQNNLTLSHCTWSKSCLLKLRLRHAKAGL